MSTYIWKNMGRSIGMNWIINVPKVKYQFEKKKRPFLCS